MSKQRLLAIIGRPVLPSRSPQLYNTAFKLWKLEARYVRLASSGLADALRTIDELDISGFNVTSPFKEEIIPYLTELDSCAAAIGAVNTVIRTKKGLKGYNTDPAGVLGALRELKVNPKGKRVLILGAGGAGRSALFALKKTLASAVWVTNRNAEKGREVAKKYGYRFLPRGRLKAQLALFDLVISCIPETARVIPVKNLPPHLKLIEAAYAHPFVFQEPHHQPSFPSATGGLEWLLWQGIPALELYTGRKVDPALVTKLREAVCSPQPAKSNLVLIGFMGCGKSTLGRLIAEELASDFVDTDEEIEKQTGLTVLEIFSRRREQGFRKLEASLIPPLLQRSRRSVISLGGGAVKEEKIRRALASSCHTVWLWTPLKEALERVDGCQRPLLKTSSSPGEIEKLFQERISLYARAADLIVANRRLELDQTIRLIIDEIRSAL